MHCPFLILFVLLSHLLFNSPVQISKTETEQSQLFGTYTLNQVAWPCKVKEPVSWAVANCNSFSTTWMSIAPKIISFQRLHINSRIIGNQCFQHILIKANITITCQSLQNWFCIRVKGIPTVGLCKAPRNVLFLMSTAIPEVMLIFCHFLGNCSVHFSCATIGLASFIVYLTYIRLKLFCLLMVMWMNWSQRTHLLYMSTARNTNPQVRYQDGRKGRQPFQSSLNICTINQPIK